MKTTRHLASAPDAGATLELIYAPCGARVDSAYTRMRRVATHRHTPVQQRQAATELIAALRDATAIATQALDTAGTAPVRKRPRLSRRQASRAVPATAQHWSAELVRLAQIGVWLRRTVMDEVGAGIATTVRVGNRAATGPHIAGMVAEPDSLVAATMGQPRIGVDLQAVVDGVDQAVPSPSPSAAAHADDLEPLPEPLSEPLSATALVA